MRKSDTSTLSPKEAAAPSAKFPIRGILIGLTTTLLLLAAMAIHATRLNSATQAFLNREARELQMNGQVVWLDEVLTMSARLGAATGDPQWEARYRQHEPSLDAAITELKSLAADVHHSIAAEQTDAANAALVAMENRAFDLVRAGDRAAAAAVLSSEEYASHKATYASGMRLARSASGDAMQSRAADQNAIADRAVTLIGVAMVIAVALWCIVLRTLYRHWDARRRVEVELVRQRSILTNVLENIPCTVFWKDRELVYRGGNTRLALEAGLTSVDELPGCTDFDMAWTRQEAEFFRACDRKVIDSGVPILNLEETQHRADGTAFTLLTSKVPMQDPSDGSIIGILGIYSDITARRQADEERERLSKQLVLASRQAGMAEVAAGVLHNVGNVLNSVNVSAALVHSQLQKSAVGDLQRLGQLVGEQGERFGQFVASDPRGRMLPTFLVALAAQVADERRGMLAEVENLVKNIDHIKGVVAMQQAYAGRSSLCEPAVLSELMEDALRMNADSLTRHRVRIERDYDASVPQVTVDRHKVLQVLVNLMTNAKQAMDAAPDDRRTLTLRIARSGGGGGGGGGGDERVLLQVTDTGRGIAPEHLGRIFEHGFTTKRDGHGFGLHSGALAAREMGGRIYAASDGPGRGATFTLEVPIQHVQREAA